MFQSYFRLQNEEAIRVNCRDLIPPPSFSNRKTLDFFGTGGYQSQTVHAILWELLLQSFVSAAKSHSLNAFSHYIEASIQPHRQGLTDTVGTLAMLLSNSLATWTQKVIIIMDGAGELDTHDFLDLDHAMSCLAQSQGWIRFLSFHNEFEKLEGLQLAIIGF